MSLRRPQPIAGAAPERELGKVFHSCVESSGDAIMLTDAGGTITYVNPAWERIYGFRREEAIGATPRLLRSGHHDGAFYQRMWGDILDPRRGFWKGEVVNRAKAGNEIPVQLTISPFRGTDGTIHGYMSIAIDITERKQMESQILRQDRLASIGLLASGLAHEIGTPLGVVRGRAEYLLSSEELQVPVKQSLEVIVTQIDRVSKLIYSLLNLARAGKEGDAGPLSIGPVLAEVQSLLSPRLAASDIRLKLDIPPAAKVLAEPERLEQVFLNLLMNAVHAVETEVRRGNKADHEIRVLVRDRKTQWEISIEDTGCGIAPKDMAHLFKPFFTTKDVGEGTGLGLAITHQILQGWNGSIWAENLPGRGAAFRLRLSKG